MVAKRDNVVGQRVQAPAHGHNPLEIMTQQDYTQHWITPPPELVSKWTRNRGYSCSSELWDYLATQAAQWGADQQLKLDAEQITQAYQAGADQELEACCKWLPKLPPWSADDLRRHRRPKPPSLKEQALNDLDDIPTHDDEGRQVVDLSNIRRAIEQLPD